jgi:hypothetical protein
MERRPTYNEIIRENEHLITENARLQAEVIRLRGGEQRPEKLPPGTPDPRD